jgi:hypothetical protein
VPHIPTTPTSIQEQDQFVVNLKGVHLQIENLNVPNLIQEVISLSTMVAKFANKEN